MDEPAPARDLDLLVAGEINPDVIVTDPDPRPVFGQHERFVEGIRLVVGSSSVITACGAARLGLRVAMAGVVGDDPLGRFMLEAMGAHGLDTGACRVDPRLPTGATVVLGNGTDRAILTSRGTIGELRASDVPAALLRRARHLHLGSWFLQAAEAGGVAAAAPGGAVPAARAASDGPASTPEAAELAALLGAARAAGCTTSVDPNWDPTRTWDGGFAEAASTADVILPNAAEACHLAGVDDPRDAALALARRPAADGGPAGPVVVVKLGAGGALAATPDGTVVRVPAPRVESVDTTGAGDSFNAGFLAAWLDGRPLEACLRFAVACGTLSTGGVGGTDAQPTRAEVEALLAGGAW